MDCDVGQERPPVKHRNRLGERKETTRGLLILVARLTTREENFSALPLLCQNEINYVKMNPAMSDETKWLPDKILLPGSD